MYHSKGDGAHAVEYSNRAVDVLRQALRDDAATLEPFLEDNRVIKAATIAQPSGPNDGPASAERVVAEQAVREAMAQWREAKVRHNLSAMDGLMSPNFIEVNQNGDRFGRQELLAFYKPNDLIFDRIVVDNANVRIVGTVARVTGTHLEQVKYRGRDVGGRLGFEEVYVKGANGVVS